LLLSPFYYPFRTLRYTRDYSRDYSRDTPVAPPSLKFARGNGSPVATVSVPGIGSANVRLAWEATTKDLTDEERIIRGLQMGSRLFIANMHFDSKGQFIRSSQPGDTDWVNPFAVPDFSYRNMANDWLDYLNRFSAQIPPDQLQRDLRFWSSFRDNLAWVVE